MSLQDVIEKELLLPTPTARATRSGRSNLMGTNARPLSEVIEMTVASTGAPTSRPSNAGNASSDEQHLFPLSPEPGAAGN